MDTNLKRRAGIFIAWYFAIMGLVVFLPAWSLYYWQAWLYLFVFFTWVTAITYYFLKRDSKIVERRLRVGPIAEKERKQKIIQAVLFLCFALLIALPGLDHRLGWSDVPAYLVVAGDVFISLGYWISFRVMKVNSYAANVIEVVEGQTVVTTGPYRVVRHPMYAGGLLILLGTPIALGSYWALVFVFPILVVIVWRLMEEERFLAVNLPGYAEYQRKTRHRLVPFVW